MTVGTIVTSSDCTCICEFVNDFPQLKYVGDSIPTNTSTQEVSSPLFIKSYKITYFNHAAQ
jgi:hypothetical protein